LGHWLSRTHLAELPPECRPASRADGYAIQAEVARLSGQAVAGWKIAATSLAGQRHINVDGPIAGCVCSRAAGAGRHSDFARRQSDARRRSRIRVSSGPASAESARGLLLEEVLAAVGSLHPAIEVPDSRYLDLPASAVPS
jgi:2-keto-4-pentenoate hydratase